MHGKSCGTVLFLLNTETGFNERLRLKTMKEIFESISML